MSWAVHRDIARLLADCPHWFRDLGSEAFALLFVLEARRGAGSKPDRFHYGELAQDLGVSTNTLRRWLRTLKTAGVVTTAFVPGTHNAQAYFQIHLDRAPRGRPASRGPRRQRKRFDARHSQR